MIYSEEQIRFEPYIQRCLELFHWKVMPCNCTETNFGTFLTRIFFYVFLLFYAYLTILFCWELKFRFCFISETSYCFQIWRLDKLVIKVFFFLLYLEFIWVCWTALVAILAFFVPYLLNFCYFHSAVFATAPSFTSLRFLVSLLIISNMFCMLF